MDAPYLVPRGPLQVLAWPALEEAGVSGFVTTRNGGVSEGPYQSLNLGLHVGDDEEAVIENRRRAAEALGVDLADLVFCNQSHSRGVATVGREDRGRGAFGVADAIGGIDALVTATPGVGLVMMAADCSPLILADPAAGVVGCVHSGWRGAVARVGAAAVGAMADLGAHPARIVAAIGPTVSATSYQVGPEVAAAVADTFGAATAGEVLRPDDEGRWRLDLQEANVAVLVDAGVPPDQIHRSPLHTGDAPFFSDRAVRPCGRMAALAALPA